MVIEVVGGKMVLSFSVETAYHKLFGFKVNYSNQFLSSFNYYLLRTYLLRMYDVGPARCWYLASHRKNPVRLFLGSSHF
jgi:hypothetical protein